MPENAPFSKKQFSPDWLVHGILTKIGDGFDRLTGRGWKPSSSLATSELIERLKHLIDAEIRETEDKRKFVPHNIKLKMQWDKFSTDSEASLKKLENELLIALVDHINDKRYYTSSPLTLEVKPDYFTTGVKLFVGFEQSEDNERETAIDVSLPGFNNDTPPDPNLSKSKFMVTVSFVLNGQAISKILSFEEGKRLSIGRTKENDLSIGDSSISKIHASIMMKCVSEVVVADTGSTNGTFIDGKRIPYGKAMTFSEKQKLSVGTVDLAFEIHEMPGQIEDSDSSVGDKTDVYSIRGLEFTSRKGEAANSDPIIPATTLASIPLIEDVVGPEDPKTLYETTAPGSESSRFGGKGETPE